VAELQAGYARDQGGGEMPTFTMRLPENDYEALQAMSLLTGRPMAELVRDAVAASITDFASSADLESRYQAELRARESALEKLKQRLTPEQQAVAEEASADTGDTERKPARV
jgi:predicted DNA-binding protein